MGLTRDNLVDYLIDQHDVAIEDLGDDAALFTSSLLDSFAMVDLIVFIEREAGIRIAPTEVSLDNMDSIGRILRYAEAKVSKTKQTGSLN